MQTAASTNMVIMSLDRFCYWGTTNHTLAVYNNMWTRLASTTVPTTATPGINTNSWTSGYVIANPPTAPYNLSWLNLAPNTSYYVVSQESAWPGNDPFYDWPGLTVKSSLGSGLAYSSLGALYSAFGTQAQIPGTNATTYVPIVPEYFCLPHGGYVTEAGAKAAEINSVILTNGGFSYQCSLAPLSNFPNYNP
jgi:hypothetical protein